MTETNDLASKKAADQRLALLALATTAPESRGTCLDPEQLAALVEGRLSPEEADTCLAHLADCEECYALWLQLDRLHQEQAASHLAKITRRRISRPRILAAVGTLLAAAASLAVFFDLTTRLDRSTLPRLSEQPKLEQRPSMPSEDVTGSQAPSPTTPAAPAVREQADALDYQVATPSAEPVERGRRSKMAQPESIPSGGYSNAAPAQKRVMQETGKGAEKQEAQTSATNTATLTDGQQFTKEGETPKEEQLSRQHKAKSMPTAPPTTLRSASPAAIAEGETSPLNLIDWENRIRQDCHSHPSTERLALLSREGLRLLRQPAGLGAAERQRVQRILTALDAQTPVERKCQTLLNLLEQPSQQQKP